MRIDILTLFPQLFEAPFGFGIFKRAIDNGLVQINPINIRDYTHDKHHVTDDTPYGGGGGMVMKPEPVFEAIETVLGLNAEDTSPEPATNIPIILLTPQGRVFNQSIAQELSQHPHIVLLCGRYEGIDERSREHLVTDEISIGDYVLTGGELPALILIDAISRFLPDVLGDPTGAQDDSHAMGLLEYPHYTRPPEFRGWKIPEVLLSGAHAKIDKWRREQALLRTLKKRPDMLEKADLSKEDKKFIESLKEKSEK